jgi:hypothetical protein
MSDIIVPGLPDEQFAMINKGLIRRILKGDNQEEACSFILAFFLAEDNALSHDSIMEECSSLLNWPLNKVEKVWKRLKDSEDKYIEEFKYGKKLINKG